MAVGDGANDIPMLLKAGLGIALDAKASVQQQANACLNQHSLWYVLAALGYSDSSIADLSENIK